MKWDIEPLEAIPEETLARVSEAARKLAGPTGRVSVRKVASESGLSRRQCERVRARLAQLGRWEHGGARTGKLAVFERLRIGESDDSAERILEAARLLAESGEKISADNLATHSGLSRRWAQDIRGILIALGRWPYPRPKSGVISKAERLARGLPLASRPGDLPERQSLRPGAGREPGDPTPEEIRAERLTILRERGIDPEDRRRLA